MPRQPYGGSHQKLVIALDLGTTFSGVSYRFPAQDNTGGNAKIPTVLYYNPSGDLMAAGAEALDEGVIRSAEDEGWVKYSRFKLHLRPRWVHTQEINDAIAPLPPGKDVVEVFGDFYAYLVQCTLTFIQESHQNGSDVLSFCEDHIEYIISHPNGWEGIQQKKLRRAAVYAGIIPDNDKGQERIHFVTEGEASLHFCIDRGLSPSVRNEEGVMIIDAGGGTVDIIPDFPNQISPHLGVFAGSIFVTRRAEGFLKKKLKGSQYEGETELIAECFDKTTKHRFRNAKEPDYIKFGTMRDTDARLDIRSGQLRLAGSDVASFFEPSASSILWEIDNQRLKARRYVSSIFLVGGFAESTWLFLKMRERVELFGVTLSRPANSPLNKAVADGAISFYIHNIVSARVAKYNYGLRMNTVFNSLDPEHARRRGQVYTRPDGEKALGGQYSIILPKDARVSKTQEFRHSFKRLYQNVSHMNTIRIDMLCYLGDKPDPRWMETEPANTGKAAKALKPLRQKKRGFYYRFDYDIIIFFGRTELKAQICWMEDGIEKRGPAQILYDRDR
ncbi:hypothetical protein ARMGADRAFT_1038780 [Armillaria gallica]|uniref:Actin-like ATPase domain-containing protein n=1 Tax=Armillaria gallica TaxID=47427 RepID=A0A2H3CGF5_ARMGA|nr:hypothetical protein ARMGADRAFT_1038780 [Armillaria gallica]